MSKPLDLNGTEFVCGGKPFRILSGAMHYFRIVPGYWEDRLLRARACGLNTIETVIPWNIHEPKKGEFCFEGMADVVSFLKTADRLGLKAIVRPGPFICAEWDFGGFPAWLLQEPDIALRCMNQSYLRCVDAYFDVLMNKLVPLLATNGGPIIAMQVENEYGSYGNDSAYLTYLKEGLEKRGVDVLLFTSDGPTHRMLTGGTLPEVYKTINFGSRWREGAEILTQYQENKPLMCMEFWNGWFDHWGEGHVSRDPADAANELKSMLQGGMSVNLYMVHGGTNFGFFNGANYADAYNPIVTSYDYDAPISEEGDLTPKFHLFRQIIEEATGVQPPEPPAALPRKDYGTVRMTQSCSLFSCLGEPIESTTPFTMEACGQGQGFLLYRTEVAGKWIDCPMTVEGLHDRALIFVNGSYQATLYCNDAQQTVTLNFPAERNVLDILVENMGRVNYGPHVGDKKGITGFVSLEYQRLFHWKMYPILMQDVSSLAYAPSAVKGPAFYHGTLVIQEMQDTYFSVEGWHKGTVFINGFNIGRYWEIGPQRTLYIPAPLLKPGENEIVVFELYDVKDPTVRLVDRRILDGALSDSRENFCQ